METIANNKAALNCVEIWKDIVGYEGMYQVSNLGRVKSLNYNRSYKEKILKNTISNTGYFIICLIKFKLLKNFLVHRLVAKAFINNKENKPQVNHIDGCKTNNNILNLEWSTAKENTQHAFKTGLNKIPKGKQHHLYNKKGKQHHTSKTIYQYTKDLQFIKKWDSTMDVKRELNINDGNISSCALGKLKSAGGFRWSYTKL